MAADIAAVREWVGASPDDDAIEETWGRFTTATTLRVERTALAILRARRADIVASPASWGVSGDYNENQGKGDTLKALDAEIARLESITGETAGSSLPPITQAPICGGSGYR